MEGAVRQVEAAEAARSLQEEEEEERMGGGQKHDTMRNVFQKSQQGKPARAKTPQRGTSHGDSCSARHNWMHFDGCAHTYGCEQTQRHDAGRDGGRPTEETRLTG